MPSVTDDTFGPLVAYLVPGAVALVGVAPFAPSVRAWLAATPPDAPTVGGFLYLTVASLAAGMTVSAVRWAVVDTLHAATGLTPPLLDFSRLAEGTAGYRLLIDIHYKHYLFYANMVVATAAAYAGHRVAVGNLTLGWADVAVTLIEVVFLLTSRDCLRKYYARAGQLLTARPRPSRAPARAAGRRRGASPRGQKALPGAG